MQRILSGALSPRNQSCITRALKETNNFKILLTQTVSSDIFLSRKQSVLLWRKQYAEKRRIEEADYLRLH